MNILPAVTTGKMGLLVGPKAEIEAMYKVASVLALQGPVRVLDGGNCFNVFRVARHIRRQTPRLYEALDRISVARAFTCYQVVTLFKGTPPAGPPKLVLDVLATFCDESVSVAESQRLLRIVIDHLHRFRQYGPVMVSTRIPPQPDRGALVDMLREAADQVFEREITPEPQQPRLF
jgi:hypothetical protein